MPTKLEVIRRSLSTNPGITVEHEEEFFHWLGSNDGVAHHIVFYIAPTVCIKDADELHLFMTKEIASDLKPSDFDGCWEKAEFHFGRLIFDEDIGKEKVVRRITLSDPTSLEVAAEHGFVRHIKTHTEVQPIIRRVTVRVFPSVTVASHVRKMSIKANFMRADYIAELLKKNDSSYVHR